MLPDVRLAQPDPLLLGMSGEAVASRRKPLSLEYTGGTGNSHTLIPVTSKSDPPFSILSGTSVVRNLSVWGVLIAEVWEAWGRVTS
jgi:hypothetical protein